MGNPLACAAANASIDLLLAGPWQQRVMAIEAQLREELEPLRSAPWVADVRVLGAIGVVEMREPLQMAQVQQALIERGVWLRPFGKLVYAMPPYIISKDDLHQLTGAMVAVLGNL
jgi:adenosylmethionine-8-amino-7-oxononanoate aminotransferase